MSNFSIRFISSIIILPIFLLMNYFYSSFIFLLISLLVISIYELLIFFKKKKYCTFFLLNILIIFFIFCFLKVRGQSQNFNENLLWIFIIVWMTDIGGYIVGNIIKGPKLCIWSPNKTISGFLGSIFFSQLSFLIVNLIIEYKFTYSYKIFLIQFFFSIISIIGDLFFSFIKRLSSIKDYSNIIPGHGGLLDRIDSLIFAIIAMYLFKIFNVL